MSSRNKNRVQSGKSDASSNAKPKPSLLEQEEEYKRLNAELEAKTAALVKEADAIMTEQEHFLRESPHKSYDDTDSDEVAPQTSHKDANLNDYPTSSIKGLLNLVDADEYEGSDDTKVTSGRVSSRSTKSTGSSRRPNSGRVISRPTTGSSNVGKKTGKRQLSSAGSRKSKPADDVALPSDFMSKFTLDGAISNIEQNLGDVSERDIIDDDILPGAAAEMGSEAQIRFLKAKLRVVQEEAEKLSQECRSGVEERKKMNQSLKNGAEEQARLLKNSNAMQAQIEKQKKMLEDERRKSESFTVQVQNLRKELDLLKRDQKQDSVAHNATEVRLNRALEDAERYKSQLQKDRSSNKETAVNDRKEMERLRTDNKRLERLKTEMNTVFKKQQKLISILKRQILHVEATKLLSFTEEEFVRALDWGSKQ